MYYKIYYKMYITEYIKLPSSVPRLSLEEVEPRDGYDFSAYERIVRQASPWTHRSDIKYVSKNDAGEYMLPLDGCYNKRVIIYMRTISEWTHANI